MEGIALTPTDRFFATAQVDGQGTLVLKTLTNVSVIHVQMEGIALTPSDRLFAIAQLDGQGTLALTAFRDAKHYFSYILSFDPALLKPIQILISSFSFEYGTATGDSVLANTDDGCSSAVMASLQFPMYGILYRNIYVCSNGIVSFSEAVTTPNPTRDDNNLHHSYLAPYFTDLQLGRHQSSEGGVIYYQAYDIIKNNSLQKVINVIKAQEYVLRYETDLTSFVPTFLLVVTWDRVAPYPANTRGSERVSFQLILVTDGLNTFAIYMYFKDKMRLQFNDVFIGYAFKIPGIVRRNVNSFTRRAYDIDSTVITNGYRGVLYYRLTPSGFQFNSDQRVCLSWWSENQGNKNHFANRNSFMPSCPCFLDWLWWDSTFGSYYFQDSFTYCAVIRPRWSYSPHGKTCCYNVRTGQYQRSAPTAGGFLQYHKITHSKQYQAIDARMKDYCCHRTNLCHLYYELRPVSRCYNTFPFIFAIFWGDPHIETLDKKKFTFNGWGEYTLVSLDNFQLQSRTSRAERANGGLSNATIFSAFAAKDIIGSTIHVELNSTKDGLIVYAQSNENSSSFNDYTLDFADMSKEFNVQDEYISLSRDDSSRTITIVFSTDISLNITVGVKMLAVSVMLPTEYKGKSRGLLGNFDGNPDNDFMFPNGTVLSSNATERDIFKYGQTWAVKSNESIFHYPTGTNHVDFHHKDFEPQFIDEADPEKVSSAKQICGKENQECIFDLVFTENEAVANYTRNIEQQTSESQIKLENNVPIISGNGTVYASIGSTVNVHVNGSDDGNFTYQLLQNTLNASVHVRDDHSAIITFVVVDSNPVSLSITAEDNYGVQAPSLDVSFYICTGCSKKGYCNYTREREDSRSTPLFKYALCVCDPYYEGNDCEVDFDGCASTPCGLPRTCIDNPAPVHQALNLPYNCSCPFGYVVDVGKCVDLNECNTSSHGCNQTCVNTDGTYYCTCGGSLRLHANKKDCEDIDECNDRTDGCDQVCKNTYGGFECACQNGYDYNTTAHKCVQVSASTCLKRNCTSAYGCTKDEKGNEMCFCRSGYRLTANDSCDDINECDQHICSQYCENIAGSFNCKCFPGYTLDTDKTTCTPCMFPYYGENCSSVCECGMGAKRCDRFKGCICESGWTGSSCDQDVNECLQNPFICNNTLKNCINSIGSYSCNCITGYEATNDTCTDINECEDPTTNTCEQTCINTLSGFTCACWPGYKKDPDDFTKCIDVDECASGLSECDQECSNSVGRYSCSCYFGYELTQDRKTCIQVEDPCLKYGNITCDQICFFNLTTQSSTCACKRGYKLSIDNKTCDDIEECTELNGTLNQCSNNSVCTNTNGSYTCSCEDGSKLDNDGRTCSTCDDFHYGPNCDNQCNCSVGVLHCDKITGCVCKPGWDGDLCHMDIDECRNTSVCSGENNNCVNTPGSYECTCKDGYEKNATDSCVGETINKQSGS
ncbi:hypothetical protein ACJMK2_023807 [Sinanodonta woodiana]|uniref:Mucin-like protein n=1 Tax=Sinanodonta woodiana TaxID=1069815 RepID=A0ABD3T684_SINWO